MNFRFFRQGWATFITLWFGQVVSLFGSQMTSFAVGVWLFEITQSATNFALVMLFTIIPGLIIQPFAGVLIDRWPRKTILIAADTFAAITSIGLLLIVRSGSLTPWHIYALAAASSLFGAFQGPAYTATTSLLLPKDSYQRAAALNMLGGALSRIAAPILAGVLYLAIGFEGVVVIDLATFVFAVVTTSLLALPNPPIDPDRKITPRAFLQDARMALQYMRSHRGLIALIALFAGANFFQGIVLSILTPMVLSFTTAEVLGRIITTAGIGMLISGVAIEITGGPKRKIPAILAGNTVASIALVLAGLKPNAVLVAISGFIFLGTDPVVLGSASAFWQTKTPPEMQGRVFSLQRLIEWSTLAPAFLLAGPVADNIFNPLLAPQGALADTLIRQIFGTGPSRGIGLMFAVAGVLSLLLTAAAALYRPLLRVESELPDADQVAEVKPAVIPEPVLAESAS